MQEIICSACGLPARFRAFLTRRGERVTMATACPKGLRLRHKYGQFLRFGLPNYKEVQRQLERARLAGSPVIVAFSKFDIIQRDGRACFYCGKFLKYSRITLDHLTPLSRGGHHTPDNIRIACGRCNETKDNKTFAEYYAISKIFLYSFLKSED